MIPLSSVSGIFINNSAISLATIGSSAFTCHTELSTCCRGVDNNGSNALGRWTGPDGNSIPDSNTNGFYVSRGMSSISLNLAEGSSEVAGTYCCQVPRESGTTTTHCVMVTGECMGLKCASVMIMIAIASCICYITMHYNYCFSFISNVLVLFLLLYTTNMSTIYYYVPHTHTHTHTHPPHTHTNTHTHTHTHTQRVLV